MTDLRFWQRLQGLLLVFMVGALWTIGYVVAPVLFSFLDNDALAGRIAGQFFHVSAWIVLSAGVMLMFLFSKFSSLTFAHWPMRLLAGMLGGMALLEFVLNPMVQQARDSQWFGPLHGVSALLYLIISITGGFLVWMWVKNTGERK